MSSETPKKSSTKTRSPSPAKASPATKTPVNPKPAASKLSTPAVSSKAKPQITLHYRRYDSNYEGWGVHLWNAEGDALDSSNITSWETPKALSTDDGFGKSLTLPLRGTSGKIGFIIHKGHEKDPDMDRFIAPMQNGIEVWLVQGKAQIFSSKTEALGSV